MAYQPNPYQPIPYYLLREMDLAAPSYDPRDDYIPSYGSSPYPLDPAVAYYNEQMYNRYGGPEEYRFNDMYTPGMASGPDLRNSWNSLPAPNEPMRYGPPQAADIPLRLSPVDEALRQLSPEDLNKLYPAMRPPFDRFGFDNTMPGWEYTHDPLINDPMLPRRPNTPY